MSLVQLRRRVGQIVDIPSPPHDRLGVWFDRVIIALITLNVLAVVLESVSAFHARYDAWLRAFELVSVGVFAGEYALRLWSIVDDPRYAHPVLGRLRFMVTPLAIVDLLVILPVLLVAVDLRFLRALRLLRLLKLSRYSESMQILGNVLRRSRQELLTTFSIVLLALLMLSSLMYYAERDAQPDKFSSIPAAFWWGIITLTTTGYGDVVPMTVAGKLIGGVAAIIGVGVIALPVGILASRFIEEIDSHTGKKKKSAVTLTPAEAPACCPHCGEALSPLRPEG